MESSWYYARYTSPGAADIVDTRAKHWLPVDQYIGGIEHAILHLLYFRFFHKLLRDAGFVDSDEPATNLLCQGMVIAETYYRDAGGGKREWINPADVDVRRDERGHVAGATLKADGQPVHIGHVEKMSKSKNNGVDPQAMVLLLNPVTPHVSHRLWQVLGHAETLLEDVPFPRVDPAALVRDAITLAVQVNGKLRGTLEVAPDTSREAIEAAAVAEPNVARFLEGLVVKKVIVVPGKIVNIVAG